MKKLLLLLCAIAAHAATVSISDTLYTAAGDLYNGTVTITLNAPGSAQPLYNSAGRTLTGFQKTVTVTNGVFAVTLENNGAITPAGTSYTARFRPSTAGGGGEPWVETWVVGASTTLVKDIRSTTVPTPTTTFAVSQLAAGGAALGECLVYSGTAWEPGSCAEGAAAGVSSIAGTANQITASAATGAVTLSIPTNPTLPGTTTGTFSGNLTGNVTGNVSGSSGSTTGNAATATALAANGANCSAGQFPLGVDASGAVETCTALPTTIAGTANQITASASTGAVTLSIPTNPTLPGTTTGTFSGNLTGNVTGNVSGSSGSTTGNAATATALATPRAINGTNFDGTAAITVTASLPANPTACSAGAYVTDIAADGTLTCDTPAGGAHTQNTDTGTTQTSFQIDSGNTGPRIKNSSGTLQVRNAADGALAPLTASVITADSFTTSGSGAGAIELTQGTAPSAGTTSVKLYAHSAVTSYIMRLPLAAATGFVLGTNTAGDVVQTFVGFTGTGDVVRAISPTLVTPALGTPSALVGTNISGTAASLTAGLATALAANGSNCSGSIPRGVDASGAAEGCADVDLTTEVTGVLPDANIATGVTRTIASGTKALDTDAIASEACDTMTATATGAASTDVVTFTANADITAVTGYAPETTGGLAIYTWLTTNTLNIKVCNPSSSSITPGAVSLNWRIVR